MHHSGPPDAPEMTCVTLSAPSVKKLCAWTDGGWRRPRRRPCPPQRYMKPLAACRARPRLPQPSLPPARQRPPVSRRQIQQHVLRKPGQIHWLQVADSTCAAMLAVMQNDDIGLLPDDPVRRWRRSNARTPRCTQSNSVAATSLRLTCSTFAKCLNCHGSCDERSSFESRSTGQKGRFFTSS